MDKKNIRKKAFKSDFKRELRLASDGEIYAKVIQVLGDCRFRVMCDDGIEREGKVKGSLRKRCYFRLEDTCLISLRQEYNKLSNLLNNKIEKADILYKYHPPEVQLLISNGHIKSLSKGITIEEDETFFEEDDDDDNPEDNSDNKNNEIEIDFDLIDDI